MLTRVRNRIWFCSAFGSAQPADLEPWDSAQPRTQLPRFARGMDPSRPQSYSWHPQRARCVTPQCLRSGSVIKRFRPRSQCLSRHRNRPGAKSPSPVDPVLSPAGKFSSKSQVIPPIRVHPCHPWFNNGIGLGEVELKISVVSFRADVVTQQGLHQAGVVQLLGRAVAQKHDSRIGPVADVLPPFGGARSGVG